MGSEQANCEEYMRNLLGESGKEPIDKDKQSVEIELPPWFDAELFKKGQKNYFKYAGAMSNGMLVGLIAVLAIPSILKVLICSRRSGTPLDAYRRYIRTIFHVVAWHDSDMKSGTKAWQSITIVRKTHLASRKMCERAEQITITQRDMALTQFGFLGFLVLKPRMLGLPDTPDVMEPLIHLWRVVGYLMGIKEEFNICTDSVSTTKERMNAILSNVYRPALEKTGEQFDLMSKALLDGLWYSDVILNFRPYMCFAKRLAGCEGYEYFKSDFEKPPSEETIKKLKYQQLLWWERAVLFYYIALYEYLYKITIFRILYNIKSYVMVIFNYYFPIVAMYKFGIRKAYVRIFHGKSTEPNKQYD